MNCPRCINKLKEGARFCSTCGLSLSADNLAPTAASPMCPADGRAASDLLPGRTLDGKYELMRRLGGGGMGVIYRAHRTHIGDEVAVKVLHSSFVRDRAAAERFRREAQAAAVLRHPNVVAIYDTGEARGEDAPAYIVMELLEGESLRELLLREKKLGVGRAVSLMQDICAGVGAAHRRGTLHRDLKPDNIFVVAPQAGEERESVKVLDFGIAKLRDAADGLTLTGAVMGTPEYMSPEQCQGHEVDARTDVYALGCMMFEMLTGVPPFTARSVAGVMKKHLHDPPPRLPERSGVPPTLEAVIGRALSKQPAGRQADATAFIGEIVRAVGQPTTRQPASPAPGRATDSSLTAGEAHAFQNDHVQLRRISPSPGERTPQTQLIAAAPESPASESRANPGELVLYVPRRQTPGANVAVATPQQQQVALGRAALRTGLESSESEGRLKRSVISSWFGEMTAFTLGGLAVIAVVAVAFGVLVGIRPSSNSGANYNVNHRNLYHPSPTNAPATSSPLPVRPIVVSVNGGGDYATINEAIVNARPYARILVRPGTYRSTVVIDKPVEIIGDGPTDEIVIETSDLSCVSMQSDYALVRGMTMRLRRTSAGDDNPQFAVDISRGQLVLEDCDITSDSFACIGVRGISTNPIIRRCKLHDSRQGGIIFHEGAGGTVESCDIYGNTLSGVEIRDGSDPVIRDCRIRNNREAGLYVNNLGRGTVENCDIFRNSGSGVDIEQAGNPTIRRCRINRNGDDGVYVHNRGLGTVEDSDLRRNRLGSYTVERGSQLVRSRNTE